MSWSGSWTRSWPQPGGGGVGGPTPKTSAKTLLARGGARRSRSWPSVFNVAASIHPFIAYRLIPLCVCGVFDSMCFPQPVFGPTTNVYTVSPSPPYLLPFSSSLQRFLPNSIKASPPWCLHCKSGFDNKAMIRPYSYSKARDLFIHLSSFAWHQDA